jgi:pimeloyl-ACP methyl ester carboxylesterase
MMPAMTGIRRTSQIAVLDPGEVEYRLDKRGDATVLIFHGGHMHAGLALGEDVFTSAGYSVLVPSRPGYGRTPLSIGRSASGFSDVIAQLCAYLGIGRRVAVVGISAGGRVAVTMAARHRELVERVVLLSAVGWLPWPDRWTGAGAHLVFNGVTERVTWQALRALLRVAPSLGLRMLLRSLTILPARNVVTGLDLNDRAALVDLFKCMQSGRGFLNDLVAVADTCGEVIQPTLVIASRNDGAVPITHAEALTAAIAHATLLESRADSHFVWFGRDWPAIAEAIQTFLATRSPKVDALRRA